MKRIALTCGALALTTLLTACGDGTPPCKSQQDLAKFQVDLESEMQKLAASDEDAAMKMMDKMFTMAFEVDVDKLAQGDVGEACAFMAGVYKEVKAAQAAAAK